MTPGEWDTRWWVIYSEATPVGFSDEEAASVADRECVEQFGPRPKEIE